MPSGSLFITVLFKCVDNVLNTVAGSHLIKFTYRCLRIKFMVHCGSVCGFQKKKKLIKRGILLPVNCFEFICAKSED